MRTNKAQAADLALKEAEVREIDNKVVTDAEKLKVDKLNTLGDLLQSYTIDGERTILGSEPFFIPVFNTREQTTIKAKIMELVNKL